MDLYNAALSLLSSPKLFPCKKTENWLLKVTWMNINSWKCHVALGIIPNKPQLIWKNCSLKAMHKHWSRSKAVKSTGRLTLQRPLDLAHWWLWPEWWSVTINHYRFLFYRCLQSFGERRKKRTTFSCLPVKSPSLFQTIWNCNLWTLLLFYFECSTFYSLFLQRFEIYVTI